jgi:4-hydroxy-2-oxoheptanedioate aldolase
MYVKTERTFQGESSMPIDKIREFKEKLHDDFVLGLFSKTSDPGFIEIMGYGGFDFVIIDLEHGPNSVQSTQNLIRAAEIGGVLPIVRVKEDNSSVAGEVLDIGASGVQVPQVNNERRAREVVRRVKFAPPGMRGVCRFVRAARYSSMDRFVYFQEANETLVVVQLEGAEGLSNLESIMEVEGIDVVFIGPYDLSQSLGFPGEIEHPEVENKMKEIVRKSLQRNIAVGTFVDTPENAVKWREAGVRYIAYSVDVGIFHDACKDLVQKLRAPRQ